MATDDDDTRLLRDYATAAEAMEMLHVRAQTLYAYVSRGWINSIPQTGRKGRLYLRSDLTRVAMRSLARSGHGAVAASAMNWGEPIFPTAITEIRAQGPRYRGHLAGDLVRADTAFETVAELLWTRQLAGTGTPWQVHKPAPALVQLAQTMGATQARDTLLESFAMVLLVLGVRRGAASERLSQDRTLQAARELMQAIVGWCGFAGKAQRFMPMRSGQTMVQGLAQALAVPGDAHNTEALQAMLVLLADHELSPGTLSARVAASTGATLHSCLASALCATSGLDVGHLYDRVQDFLGTTPTRAVLVRRARELLAQGRGVPGFEHPLYPKGDPRAAQLLALARTRMPQSRASRAVHGFIDDMQNDVGIFARQELAMSVLTRAMDLPRQAPVALFVLARLAGWVAHVIEQRESGTLLRPRAKFVDPAACPSTETR